MICLGLVALAFGAGMYWFWRGPESLYLLDLLGALPGEVAERKVLYGFMAILIGSLPSAVHVYSFSIFSALAFQLTRGTILLTCITWTAVNVIFEFTQIGNSCSVSGEGTFALVLQTWCAFSANGTFDPQDIAFACVGGACAYYTMDRFPNKS